MVVRPLTLRIQGDRGTCHCCHEEDVALFRQEPGDGSLYELCGKCENSEIDAGVICEVCGQEAIGARMCDRCHEPVCTGCLADERGTVCVGCSDEPGAAP